MNELAYHTERLGKEGYFDKEKGMTDTSESTALIKIKPETDVEIMSFHTEALKLREYAEKRVIATIDDLRPATDDLSIIARVKKGMEEKRKDYLKPFQEHIKEINEAYKLLMQPIEEADRITRDKILAFQREQEEKRREEERINALRLEAARAERELKGEIIEPVELIEVSPAVPKRIYTEMGSSGQRMIRKWEIENINLVPEEYKILDSAKITKVVKAGIPSIPGIRIYEEPILTVSARRE